MYFFEELMGIYITWDKTYQLFGVKIQFPFLGFSSVRKIL